MFRVSSPSFRNFTRLTVRHFSQSAPQPVRRASPSAPSDHQSALRRSKLVHRQSSKWRIPNATPSASRSADASTDRIPESRGARLLISYHDLERALQKRGLNTVRVILIGGAATLLAVGLAWPRIKQWGAVEGAEVAAATLETEHLQSKASAMLHEVLADAKTGVQVEGLLKGAVIGLFEDEEFTERAVEWTGKVLGEALKWEEVRHQGTAYITSVFEDPESKQSAREYLSAAIGDVVADEKVQDNVAQGLWSSVRVSLIGRRRAREEKAKRDVDEKAKAGRNWNEENSGARKGGSEEAGSSVGTGKGAGQSTNAGVESKEWANREEDLKRRKAGDGGKS